MLKSQIAQIAMEYLMVIALAFMLLVPGIYLFYSYASYREQATTSTQLYNIGSEIISSARIIALNGPPARTTIQAQIPKELINVTIVNNTDFVFRYRVYTKESEIVFFSPVLLNTTNCNHVCYLNLDQGLNKIRLEAYPNYVLVRLVS